MDRKDKIIEEIWNIRGEHAKAFAYDIEAMGLALLEEEKASSHTFVQPPPHKTPRKTGSQHR
jgi:hypothetical protein